MQAQQCVNLSLTLFHFLMPRFILKYSYFLQSLTKNATDISFNNSTYFIAIFIWLFFKFYFKRDYRSISCNLYSIFQVMSVFLKFIMGFQTYLYKNMYLNLSHHY